MMIGHETFPLLQPYDPYNGVWHFVDCGDVQDPNETNMRDWQGGHNTGKVHLLVRAPPENG